MLSPTTCDAAFSPAVPFWVEPKPSRSVNPMRRVEIREEEDETFTCYRDPACVSDAGCTLSCRRCRQTAAPVDASTTYRTGSNAKLSTVISAIQASRSTTTAIQAMTTVGTVYIVKVSEIAKGNDKHAQDKGVSDNETDITGVQVAIMANGALKMQPDAETVNTSAIVAASISAHSAVTVFVR